MPKTLPPVDPNVRIPAAVLAAGRRSEELVKQTSTPAPPDVTPPPTVSETTTPPPAPEVVTTVSNPAPPAPPAPPKTPDFEQRYNSMLGRVSQLTEINKAHQRRIDELQQLLGAMQAAPAAKPTPQPLVTEREIAEYGPEFMDVVGRKAKEISAAEVNELKFKLSNLERQVSTVTNEVTSRTRQDMYNELNRSIPTWLEINSNPEFLSWLDLPDAYSGVIRKALLKKAYDANDANRVGQFFRGFIAETAATRPAVSPEVLPNTVTSSRVDLAALAAPGRARQAAANTPPDKPVITRSEITRFYADVSRGLYAGRDADKLAREREIIAATREGRLR